MSDSARDEKGSITLESALVIPLFCWAMLAVLSLFQLMEIQMRTHHAMMQVCERGASSQSEAVVVHSMMYRKWMLEYLDEDWLEKSGIEDGSRGLQMSWNITDDDELELDLSYRIQLSYGLPVISCRQIYSQRLWNGTDGEKTEIVYVYVTDNQSVYHTDLECSYLQIKVKAVEYAQLNQVRRTDGMKYTPCEICTGGKETNVVYVTEAGEVWHKKLTCYTLTRTIHRRKIEEVADLPLCVRCAVRQKKAEDGR